MNRTHQKNIGSRSLSRNSSSFFGVFEIEDIHSSDTALNVPSPHADISEFGVWTQDPSSPNRFTSGIEGSGLLLGCGPGSGTIVMAIDSACTKWFEAVSRGDVERMKTMIDEKIPLDCCNEIGQTAVHIITQRNNTAALDMLISAGADVNCQDASGLTPLHLASKLGYLNVVTRLISHGADVSAKLRDGTSALHCACQTGNGCDIVKILLDSSPGLIAAVRKTQTGITDVGLLHDASERDDCQTVELLLERGGDVNAATSAGFTALHLAAQSGCIDVVNALLKRAARLDIPATDAKGSGVVPLHLAVENNHCDVTSALLTAGADVNATRLYSGRDNISCLHLASMKRLVELLHILLDVPGVLVSARDSDGSTALHVAARCGFTDVAQLLLKKGINVDAGMMSGQSSDQTALHCAVRFRHQELARMLIRAGANVSATEKVSISKTSSDETNGQNESAVQMVDGYTALHWAVENGDLDMVCMLLDNGANPNISASFDKHSGVTALHLASQDGYRGIAMELLRVPGCFRDPLKRTENRDNITPLHQAVYNGHADTARILVENGCDVNRQADNGYSALHYASQQGNVELTKLMLKRGGDVHLLATAGDQQCITCLHLAVQSGNTDVVDALLDAGANIDAGKTMGNVSGVTALHQAVYQEKLEVMKTLLERGASVNSSMGGWYTPLHVAAEKGSDVISKELLNFGANVNAKAKLGEHGNVAPLHVAAQHGHTELVSMLVSSGADIESTRVFADRFSITPLQLAAENGFADTIQRLIDLGADINARDSMGFTALHLAIQYGYPAAVRVLVANGCNTRLKTATGLSASKMAEQSGNADVQRAYSEEKRKTKTKTRSSRHSQIHSEIPDTKPRKRRSRFMSLLCGLNKS